MERSRGMGMLSYLRNIGLEGTRLFDAQGNHFDRGIIGLRVGPHLQVWAAGRDLAHHTYPPDQAIRACHAELSRHLAAQGIT
eukprot:1173627-Prorocentrum_lima.AAC.1